jgi:Mg2+ and Co2+ transporter CorA
LAAVQTRDENNKEPFFVMIYRRYYFIFYCFKKCVKVIKNRKQEWTILRVKEDDISLIALKEAVDSYIQMINKSGVEDNIGERIIDTDWSYMIDRERESIKIILEVQGELEVYILEKNEWKSSSVNLLGNKELNNLAERLKGE